MLSLTAGMQAYRRSCRGAQLWRECIWQTTAHPKACGWFTGTSEHGSMCRPHRSSKAKSQCGIQFCNTSRVDVWKWIIGGRLLTRYLTLGLLGVPLARSVETDEATHFRSSCPPHRCVVFDKTITWEFQPPSCRWDDTGNSHVAQDQIINNHRSLQISVCRCIQLLYTCHMLKLWTQYYDSVHFSVNKNVCLYLKASSSKFINGANESATNKQNNKFVHELNTKTLCKTGGELIVLGISPSVLWLEVFVILNMWRALNRSQY